MRPDLVRGQRGFTLLEVLIAFVIAALAMGVMFEAALGGLRATETASHYQEALSLARSHLAAITTVALRAREQSGDDGHGFRWRVRITPGGTVTLPQSADQDPSQTPAGKATLYSVSVTVLWQGDGGERQVRLDSARVAGGAAKGG